MIILLLKNSMTYWWNSIFSMTTFIFHDFSGLENSFLKFHDFPECVGTLLLDEVMKLKMYSSYHS